MKMSIEVSLEQKKKTLKLKNSFSHLKKELSQNKKVSRTL